MAGEQQIVTYTHQQMRDYDDALEPGYRFCPTDSELIVYYLKRKIELGEHPKSRIYDVHVYDHHPKQLTDRYRSCGDKWYFFTTREPKYPMGTRVNRTTKNSGVWKSTQKDKEVYDFVTRRVVGTKRSLAFHEEKNKKTSWLMYEYIYNDPNFPDGSHANKLTDWVLCKMYKKEPTRTVNDHKNQTDLQVQNTNDQGEVIQQQNQLDDEPSAAKRPRVSSASPELNQANEQVQHHVTNHHLGADVNLMTYMRSMFQPNHQSAAQTFGIGYNYSLASNANPVTITMQLPAEFQDRNQGQIQSFNGSPTCEYYDHNQAISTSTNVHNTCQDNSQTLVNMQSGYNNRSVDATADDIRDWDPQDSEALLSLLESC